MSRVWYVAYGSNMLAARFGCYLHGGRAAGSRRANPGARDPSPATGDRLVELPHPLLFGGPSPTWHGGPAFLDVTPPTPTDGATTPGRAWRITLDQLADVVAQENARLPGEVTVTADHVRDGGIVLDDRYGRIVPLAPIDDEPAVTVTYVRRPPPRDPDPAYVALLRAGLAEVGLTPGEASPALQLRSRST